MRGRSLLILALAVAALGAFVWFVERDLPSTQEREERADRVLDLENEDDVDRLELAFDDRTVVLERSGRGEDDGEWRLVEPIAARADASAVSSLVRDLVSLDAARTIEGVEDRGEYGLEPPRLVATLRAGDRTRSLRFGDELPASGRRAVATDAEGPIHVVEGGIFAQATREPGDWRDRALFPGERSGIERMRVGNGEGSLLLGRRGERFWVEAPFADAADPERVDELLSALTGLRAESFVDDPARIPDSGEAAGTIEVTLRDREEPVEILVGPEVGESGAADDAGEAPEGEERVHVSRLVGVDGTWAEIETGLGSFLGSPPSSWRSPALTSWPGYDIDTIRADGAGDELVLTREGADWRRGDERILYSAASDLLSAITGFRAHAVEAGELAPDSEPALVLELTHQEGAEESFRFWRAGDEILVRPGARQVLLRSEPAAMETLEAALDAVREADALPAAPESDGTVD